MQAMEDAVNLSIRYQPARLAWLALVIAGGAMLLSASGAQAASKRGAVLVKDINPGNHKSSSTGGYPGVFSDVAGTLFFAAGDRKHGVELWRSDGTRRGTRMVKDIRPGPRPCCRDQGASSYPSGLTAVGRTLYFVADDGIHGPELWRSDGTSRGTRLVKDLNPGAGDTGPGQLTDVAGTLFFTASDGTHGDLWRSDGSAAGTMLVKEFGQGPQQGPQYLTAVGGTLYLGANGGLWRSDGTPSGTVLVKKFPGVAPCGSDPCWLTNVAGTLFLTANDGTHYGLWRSDGTETGTTLVKEAVGAIDRATVGRTLYFATLDYGDSWLWRTDGTEAGTIPITSVGATPEGDGLWPQLTNVGGTLFFVRLGELARTDSTPGGTRDLRSGILPRQLTAVGKTLYFEGFDTKHGNELWQSDGTPRGTRLVRDIRRGERSSRLGELTAVGKTLFFSANDGRHGTELWRAGPRPCKKAKAKCKKG
jgi:ELWxxDGT repeat protein